MNKNGLARGTRSLRLINTGALALLGVLGGCSGGGTSAPAGSLGGSILPPTNLSYATPRTFTVGVEIYPLAPTVTGKITSYSVRPSLPSGLTLNASSGVISGTPATITPSASYTVTAANAAGRAQAALSIAVNDVAPQIAYGSPAYRYTVAVASQPVKPLASGGAIVTWSIQPALPAGLLFSAKDGSISGTPLVGSPVGNYVAEAINSGGRATATLSIDVAAAPLLDLGHTASISRLQFDGLHVLSTDDTGHWVLWNYSNAAEIASGNQVCVELGGGIGCQYPPVALGGSTLVIGTPTGLEIRSSADGHVMSAITTTVSWAVVAPNGSYVCAGGYHGVTCWSSSGQQLFSQTGDYSQAQAFAAAGALRIALGAGGKNTIETVSTTDWSSSLGPPFSGTFHAWFTDGNRFLSTDSATNTVYVYSSESVQQDVRSLPTLGHLSGQGNWFWTFDAGAVQSYAPLNIYAVGNSALPTASYQLWTGDYPMASALTIGVADYANPGTFYVIDLSSSTPSMAVFKLSLAGAATYAALSATSWLTGTAYGVVADSSGLPSKIRFFSYGRVWSMVGSSARVVLSTASGRVLSFNAASNTLEQSITSPSAALGLSSDGSLLSVAANQADDAVGTDRTISLYELPQTTLVTSFPYTFTAGAGGPAPVAVTLSASGTILGELQLLPGPQWSAQALQIPSGTPTWMSPASYSESGPVQLSPDGSQLALSTPTLPVSNGSGIPPTTSIYRGNSLLTTLSGWAVGWIDNSSLLVNAYLGGALQYRGATIYAPTGAPLSSLQIPEMRTMQSLGGGLIYSPERNAIFSLITSTPVWASADPAVGVGAVANGEVVFVSGPLVLAQPR